MLRCLADRRGGVGLTSAAATALAGVAVSAALMFLGGHDPSRVQEVADAAAVAAAVAGPQDASAAAQAVAEGLGRGLTAWVRSSGASEPVTVEVRGRGRMRLWGRRSEVVRTASARASGGEPMCLLLLDRTGNPLYMTETPKLLAPDCAAQLNTRLVNPIEWEGEPTVRLLATAVFAEYGRPPFGYAVPPRFAQPRLADPLSARVRWPEDEVPCDHENFHTDDSSVEMRPGVYCGVVSIGGDRDVRLAPGVYVIKGELQIAHARVQAPGVTFVFIRTPDGGGGLSVGEGAVVSLWAPSDGDWQDIAVAAKPDGDGWEEEGAGVGHAELRLSGMIYMPEQRLRMTAGGKITTPAGARSALVLHGLDLADDADVRLAGGMREATIPRKAQLVR